MCQDPDAPAFRTGLERLFRNYWGPVYFFIRRNTRLDVERAKDSTQAFFLSFLERDLVGRVAADRGRFRNFVCVALRNFLANERRAEKAAKRKPGQGAILSIDKIALDQSGFDVADIREGDAEALFEEDWKRAVVEAALAELRSRARELGREAVVAAFVEYDIDRPTGVKITYDELAARHGLSFSQLNNGLHWARKEFKAEIWRELERTTASAEDLRKEAKDLFGMDAGA